MAEDAKLEIARQLFLRDHAHCISPWMFSELERKARDQALLLAMFNAARSA